MYKPISVILDWIEANATMKPEQIAIYGVSSGGYFTAQAVATDARIKAWIAATPIVDVAKVLEREFARGLKVPGWMLNILMGWAGSLNESADINLKSTPGGLALPISRVPLIVYLPKHNQ